MSESADVIFEKMAAAAQPAPAPAVNMPEESSSILIPIVLILGLAALIALFFYKRAIHEFRINQVESLEEGLAQQHERVPCVISECMGPTGLWTAETVRSRAPLATYAVDGMWPLTRFLTTELNLPEIGEDDGTALAETAGVALWATHTVLPVFKSATTFGSLYRAAVYTYAGPRGLHKTTAATSLLIATDGALSVSIMHEQAEPYMPADWHGRHLSTFTYDDTPLLGHIDYMDIILRPGNALLLPAHWTYCVAGHEGAVPLYTLIEFHHPVSAFVNRVLAVRGLK